MWWGSIPPSTMPVTTPFPVYALGRPSPLCILSTPTSARATSIIGVNSRDSSNRFTDFRSAMRSTSSVGIDTITILPRRPYTFTPSFSSASLVTPSATFINPEMWVCGIPMRLFNCLRFGVVVRLDDILAERSIARLLRSSAEPAYAIDIVADAKAKSKNFFILCDNYITSKT